MNIAGWSFPYQVATNFNICKWIFFAILSFVMIEKMASDNVVIQFKLYGVLHFIIILAL